MLERSPDGEEQVNSPIFRFSRIDDQTLPGISAEVPIVDKSFGSNKKTFFLVTNSNELCQSVLWVLPPEEEYWNKLSSRERPLLADREVEKIRNSKVAIAGAGTVGGAVAEALARQGVGSLSFADMDRVEPHNLNRGIYDINDIGSSKALALAEKLFLINPFMQQDVYNEEVSADNIDALLENCSVVISALDSLPAMWLLHTKAKEKGIPLILPTDINTTAVCDVFDYRNPNLAIFGGRIEESDLESPEAVAKIISPLIADSQMLAAFRQRLGGKIDYYPQRNIAASIGAGLAANCVTKLVCGKSVQETTIVDADKLLSTFPNRVLEGMAKHKEVARLLATLLNRKIRKL